MANFQRRRHPAHLVPNFFASGHYYGVMLDAKQFVFINQTEQSHAPTHINVVTNWFDELNRRMSAGEKQ